VRRQIQISFLSVFLTLLSVAFATAVMVRVRSYTAKTVTETTASMTASRPVSATPASTSATQPELEALPADATIEPTSSSSPETAAKTTSTAATTRAQRFRELLAAGISAVAPSAAPVVAQQMVAQKKPTPPPPVPKAAAPAARQANGVRNPATMAAGSTAGSNQPAGSDKPKNPSNDPRDPNSDTTPPQLLSIAFDPPQVQDGGDTTLVVMATDDLSGIRGISGTLTSPNGKAVQGFAQQREGETMRYTSRIHIPEKAEEGIWKISFLTMSDMATNSVTLNAAQGTLPPTAVLKVSSSASDSTPPSLRNVWLDRRAMRAGEHNTLFVDATDEKSGVHLVAAVFLSPSKLARFGVGCQKQGTADTYQCDVFPPQCLDCGDWTLEQVQMQDNANNFATVRSENPAVASIRLNITGDTCDNTPPVLQGLQMSRSEILMGRDEPVIEVIAQVTDDTCGIGGVSGQVVGPGSSSSGTFFSFQQREGNTFVGTIRLHANSARGVWRVQSITVNDKGQNLKIYYSNDPLLARATFTVK
jgi:hypothetical protein